QALCPHKYRPCGARTNCKLSDRRRAAVLHCVYTQGQCLADICCRRTALAIGVISVAARSHTTRQKLNELGKSSSWTLWVRSLSSRKPGAIVARMERSEIRG